MSSANDVSITYVDESTYGSSPDPAGAITIQNIRHAGETLSGTPITTESANIRTDRMSSGQIITGLETGGDLNFELSRDAYMDDFFALGMMSTWQAATADVSSVSFTIDGGNPQSGTLSGTGVGTGISVGDILKVTDGSNIHIFQVTTVTDADNLVVACMRDQSNFTGATSRRPAYLDIGSTINSVTLGKAYEDVLDSADEYSQTYSGAIVSGFSVNVDYGAVVSGAFNMRANGYVQEKPSYQQKVVTGGGTVTAAPTALPINPIDAPVVTTSYLATDFCAEQITLTVDNGVTPQNCIGKAAPTRYDLGTASISLSMSAYLSKTSYDAFMAKKTTQESTPLAFALLNGDGGYAFSIPAAQLAFPDPASQGANQQVMIEAAGQAKVGDNGESALRIYQL